LICAFSPSNHPVIGAAAAVAKVSPTDMWATS